MLTCAAGGPAGLADALREVLEHDCLLADAGVSEALAQALASAPAAEAALDAACSGRMPGLYRLLSHTDLDRKAAVRLPCCCVECCFTRLLMPQCRLRNVHFARVVTERGAVQALVNQKVRALGRFEDAQQLADLAGMLAEWSLVLQGRSAQVWLEVSKQTPTLKVLKWKAPTSNKLDMFSLHMQCRCEEIMLAASSRAAAVLMLRPAV